MSGSASRSNGHGNTAVSYVIELNVIAVFCVSVIKHNINALVLTKHGHLFGLALLD